MAEHQQDLDKTEKATPYKLREAKRMGQVAKSLEFNSIVILTSMLMLVYMFGNHFIVAEAGLTGRLLAGAHNVVWDAVHINTFLGNVVRAMVDIFWPLLLVMFVAAVAANFMQTGPVFSFHPVKPDFQRLNPVKGFKRVFSKKMLFEAFKNTVKLALISTVIYLFLQDTIMSLLRMQNVDSHLFGKALLHDGTHLVFQLLVVLCIIMIIDLVYTKWDFSKRMMMSRRELRDEIKRREGDPQVRAKQRELQKEAAKRVGAISRVPDADVIITNPTHLAVAVQYDRNKMRSPSVIAKGAGEVAEKIKLLANKNQIPVVENKPLARLLFKTTNIDEYVPEESFAQVAKILVWVYAMRKKRDGV
ncbi:MAG: flagellar biosynthesis protein FlhB [Gammaproteobacteria bacterium]|nr:flagellar biosynthesis protein FlhB [Gammaproteobacteria bacterium]MDH5800639.1 flagellar biosynthesis protein FlhB [Gammaproteobacteria bacterium]